jgi:hypothetical protein
MISIKSEAVGTGSIFLKLYNDVIFMCSGACFAEKEECKKEIF